MAKEISLVIGGKAGDGINQAGMLLARLLSDLGYFVYMYFDYPSLIRGGHNFAIVRASEDKILTHKDKVDYVLAINQETVNLHVPRLKEKNRVIFDSDAAKSEGLGMPLTAIIKEEKAEPIMRNLCLVGAFAKSVGISQEVLESIIKKHIPKATDLNLKLALIGYQKAQELEKLEILPKQKHFSIITGNEAIGMGLVNGGLEAYIAYPMTPSSNILHFLAGAAGDFNIKVIHPESEIGVMLMALGFSYAGKRSAVGTSGGGFCLMTESLSLAGMAELPIVIVVGQRPGPSTGMPTYTAQSDLIFVLNAGHGEFVRFVVAPGDPEEAYYWSAVALNMAWKYQIPSLILTDKTLNEGAFSFDKEEADVPKREEALFWDGKNPYKRYSDTPTGVSPLACPANKEAIVKVNSYEHDEYGITTEDAKIVAAMQEKRLRKEKHLINELEGHGAVKVYGNRDSSVALLCWGSNKGVCEEVGEKLGLKIIQVLVFAPFPLAQFRASLEGVEKLIMVENSATAQLERLIRGYGFEVNNAILKYDGRPFSVGELEERVKKVCS